MQIDDMTQSIVDLFDDEEIKDFLNKNIEDVMAEIIKRSKQVFTREQIRIAWNYEEKNTPKYSFSQAITWVKGNIPQGITSAAIYKKDNNKSITLHICFLDDESEPLLKGEYPHLVVNTIEIDNELIGNFGDKDLIILK